jgi:putative transposase
MPKFKANPKTKSAREETPSFVCELPLVLSSSDERVMSVRFDIARQVYNACLSEALRRVDLMRESKAYRAARKLPCGGKGSPAAKARTTAFRAVNERFEFSGKYALDTWATEYINHQWLSDHLDSATVQKLAERACDAVRQHLFGKRGRPRFKGRRQLDSLESKSNDAGIRWRGEYQGDTLADSGQVPTDNRCCDLGRVATSVVGHVEWRGLNLPATIDPKDKVITHGLKSRVKYVRLVRRKLNGRNRFYAQLICEGKPFQKEKNTIGQGTVGLDIGPSTIAIVAPDAEKASLEQFCGELKPRQKDIRRLQRKMDRQRRANNPDNYTPHGKVKQGVKVWHKSARQHKTAAKLAEEHRQQACYRKSLHGRMVNRILRLGNVIKLEKVSYRSFQRNFGKSVNFRAPGMFVNELKRKAESAVAQVHEFSTRTTRLSQVCHHCGTLEPKSLSVRWHICDCGVTAQRDLYSAFLASCVEGEQLNAGQAKVLWPGVDSLLQAALSWIEQPTSGGLLLASFGLRASAGWSQSRSPVKAGMNAVEAQEGVPLASVSGKMGELEKGSRITRTPRL